MEKYTPATKSKLERIVKNTEMIINYSGPSDNLKSEYNSIKDDWNTLKDDLQEKWIYINFTENDFKYNDYFNKFSEIGETNMQKIKGICEDTLAEINAEEKIEVQKQNNKKSIINKNTISFGTIVTICGIIIGGIYNHMTQQAEIRFQQGKLEVRQELTEKLNVQQNEIKLLLDSLENYKIKLKDVEKSYTKLKKSCH